MEGYSETLGLIKTMINRKYLEDNLYEIRYFIKFDKMSIEYIKTISSNKFPLNDSITYFLMKNNQISKFDFEFQKEIGNFLSLFQGLDDNFEIDWTKEQILIEFEKQLSFWIGQETLIENLIKEL